jgi:carboxylesterase
MTTSTHEQEKHAPFFMGPEETDIACLLIHGFMSSPLEMRGLAEALANQGIRVYAMAVADHTGNVEDLLRTNYKKWIASAEEGLKQLTHYPSIFVAGISLGGTLALLLASYHPNHITGIITMSTPTDIAPTNLQRYLLFLLPIARYFMKWLYPMSSIKLDDPALQAEITDHVKLKNPDAVIDFLDPQTIAAIRKRKLPVPAIAELVYLTREECRQLHAVRSPLLIIHSKQDRTVRPICAENLYRLTTAVEPKSIYWLYQSHHVVTIGPEREKVSNIIISFIKNRVP